MNSVRSRSIATAVPKKDESDEELSNHSLLSQKQDDKVSVAYDDGDKEKPLLISRRKMKLGVVKARSISSLLGQANNAIGAAESNEVLMKNERKLDRSLIKCFLSIELVYN
ncbi:hypothetical protein OIU78_019825 [Salix suchowensis]|nr:hypothetical protein OIU78_019825 [Salix suchowensis]